MTLEEYKNILLNNGIIKCNSEESQVYLFTQRGMDIIEEKFPDYDVDQWIYGLTIGNSNKTRTFLGYRPESKNAWNWSWYAERFQDIMEYMLYDIFKINVGDTYIELDDIVL